MPIFEFRCDSCGEEFESLVLKSGEEVNCPKCRATSVTKLMSGFASPNDAKYKVGAGSSAGGSSSCASCSGGNCATCH